MDVTVGVQGEARLTYDDRDVKGRFNEAPIMNSEISEEIHLQDHDSKIKKSWPATRHRSPQRERANHNDAQVPLY